MTVELRESAIKDIKQIDKTIATRLLGDMKKLEYYPNISNVKKLVNHKYPYRLRLGDYRVLFEVINDTLFVGRVLHRKEAYK